jgi:hypothetical protein
VADKKKLAILVGGGPAPGINSVIGAATIRSILVLEAALDTVRPAATPRASDLTRPSILEPDRSWETPGVSNKWTGICS